MSNAGAIRVLHVDDEPDLADMVATFLEREDDRITVETVTCPTTGLESIAEHNFDCIVSDYDMPEQNGIEFLDAVREQYPELPFILYTGKGSEEIASEAISAGVTDYLQKESGTGQYPVLANRISNAVEQYRSRQAVEETERKLSELAERTDDVLFMFDGDWSELLFVNSAYEEIWGGSIEALAENPSSFLERIHPDDREKVRTSMEQLSSGDSSQIEYRVLRQDGEQRWVRADSQPVIDGDGNVVRIVGQVRDITERKERELHLETIIDNLPGYVYRHGYDPEYPLRFVKGDAETVTGYTATELEEEVVLAEEIIHPDDREDLWAEHIEGLEATGRFDSTYRITTKDGDIRWIRDQGQLIEDPVAGEEVIDGFITDVSDHIQRERELKRQQTFIDESLDALQDVFYLIDTDGDLQRWNSKVPELTGYSDEEIGSMNALDFFEGEHREAISRSISEILETGSHLTEAEIATADGRHVRHEFRGVRMTDDEGEPTGIIGIARDITERKERERQLEEKTEELEQLATKFETQYRTLFEEAPVMTALTRCEDGRPIVEDCNSQFVETLGYEADAIIGSELAEFYTPDSAEILLSGGYRRSLDGKFNRERRDLVSADGEVVETLLRAVPRRTADGELVGTVAMYIDITEREAVKRANQRLEEFTSVVSHDLRNPLNVATSRLELAAEECDSEHLGHAEQALDRMDALIDDLLTLAREGSGVTDPQSVALAEMIAGCWENVGTKEASLVTDIDRAVRADGSRLKQVFENLFRNAVEHGGADVTVTVGELDDGFYIEDDGPGVPVDERDDIFEAGYSRSTEGTGFGLSIVEQIVTAHDWAIRVTDGSEGGARFEITGVEFVAA